MSHQYLGKVLNHCPVKISSQTQLATQSWSRGTSRDVDGAIVNDANVQPLPPTIPIKKRSTHWTPYEQMLFLNGLNKYGKGNWKDIAKNCVKSRTSTQVASHAQKCELSLTKPNKKRKSIHDITLEKFSHGMDPQKINPLPPSTNWEMDPLRTDGGPAAIRSSILSPPFLSPRIQRLQRPQHRAAAGDDPGPTNWVLPSTLNPVHPPNVETRQELQQTQQVLHSNLTNNLPQQMGGCQIHHINPQSADQRLYTLSDIFVDLHLKNRIHPPSDVALQQPPQMLHSNPTNILPQQMDRYRIPHVTNHHNFITPPQNWNLPPRDLTHLPDVTQPQHLLELQQQALKSYHSYPPNNCPQQIDDGYGIQQPIGVAMQQPQQVSMEKFMQCMVSGVTNHNQLPPSQDWINPLDGDGMQPLLESLQLDELWML